MRPRRSAGFALLPAVVLPLVLLTGPLAAEAQEAGEPVPAPPPAGAVPGPAEFQLPERFEDPQMEAQVRKLAAELRCPTCQALSIADSPSELSFQMKGVIRDRLREGMTPEEVRQHFVAAYGEWILLSPEPRGFNLLVYVLPFGALLLGFVVVGVGVRRWLAVAPPARGTGDAEELPADPESADGEAAGPLPAERKDAASDRAGAGASGVTSPRDS